MSNQFTAAAEQLRHISYQKTKLDRDLTCVVVVEEKEERSPSCSIVNGSDNRPDTVHGVAHKVTITNFFYLKSDS